MYFTLLYNNDSGNVFDARGVPGGVPGRDYFPEGVRQHCH